MRSHTTPIRCLPPAPLLAGLALLTSCGPPVEASTEPETVAPQSQGAPAPPAALRVRLFDRMAEAEMTGLPSAGDEPETRRTQLDFDARSPERLWFGRPQGRRVDYLQDFDTLARVDPAGGREGGGLRLGPGLPEDRSRAVFVVPAAGGARVTVSGRVRLQDNPRAESPTSREVLRVIEHDSLLEDPTGLSRNARWRATTHRCSRRVDPSGWDRFECTFISKPGTGSLEIQLLHRSGESEAAVTRFDDLSIEQTPLSGAQVHAELRARHRPRTGEDDAQPWRLRVTLRGVGGQQQEVRDALLLPPPATLSIPLRLAPPGSGQRLRFHCGVAPEFESGRAAARIEVAFHAEGGEVIPIGAVGIDLTDGRARGEWHEARLDLEPAAGRTGRLVFAARAGGGNGDGESSDARGESPQASTVLDPLLLATPRIEPAGTPAGAFNVLLIGVDTLRADRMSAFGYERPTTPNLARLADEGVRFARARSQAPWTLPSFASILTSMYPSRHGAGRGGHDEWTPIDPTTTSLAEILARLGYETRGMVANGLISPAYGIDQGFEAYGWSWGFETALRDAERVADFVADHEATPWLLFWHIMDPHLPYSTGEDLRSAFTDADYDGRFARGRRGPQVPFEQLDPRPGRRWFTHEGPPPPPDLTEADRRFVHDYYDAEVAEMDAAVGRVLDALRASGQWERTIVALIADHGEGLGDHGHYHHGYTLFDDQVHVPMLLRIPGRDQGRVVERPVAAIDLAPTILGALGLEPPAFFEGVDRLAASAPEDDAYFIEYPTYDSSAQKAWVLGDFKYVHDPVFHTEALYHLGRDPGETRDVADEFPAVVARARDEMDAFRWEHFQKGRFHLRVRGRAGQRLTLRITTDDLFDANFACRPQRPETDFEMDLERRHLRLDTTLERDRLELVFWCRGEVLELAAALDGEPLPDGLQLGDEDDLVTPPAKLPRGRIPIVEGADLGWPGPGQATLWLETGVGHVLPVVPTPAEIEMLQQLGYAR